MSGYGDTRRVVILYLPIPLDLLPLFSVCGAAIFLMFRGVRAVVYQNRRRQEPRLTRKRRWTDRRDPDGLGPRLLDTKSEVLGAVRQVEDLARRRKVRMQVAIQSDLAVWAEPLWFRKALNGLLENAIEQAPCGKVMIGGMRQGGRIQIAVLDDGEGEDGLEQQAVLRWVARIITMQGGTLDIESRRGVGTLVVMRMPEPLPAPGTAKQTAEAAVS
jgi:signal transduction histidine kinase